MTYDPDVEFSLEDALHQAASGAMFGASVSSLDSLISSIKSDGFLSGFYAQELEELENQYGHDAFDLIAENTGSLENQNVHDILNVEESGSVTRYIGGSPYTLNQKLRDGVALSAEEAQSTAALDEALDKLPAYQGVVTRDLSFLDLGEFSDFVRDHAPGTKITTTQFTSATIFDSYQEFPQVRMLIRSKNARDIRAFNPEEAEVLFPRGTQFRIVAANYVDDIFILEVIEL